MKPATALTALLLVACNQTDLNGRHPKQTEDDGEHDEQQPRNASPVITSVTVSPPSPYADSQVSCAAAHHDPDGDDVTVSYAWTNASTGASLGTGAVITLNPSTLSPGEGLQCIATATDPGGLTDRGSDDTVAQCGFADAASLRDASVNLHIVFRPYITDELIPGYEGEPWDWDGSIPGWISTLVEVIAGIASMINQVYPNTYTGALAYADDVLDVIEDYAPELMEGTVPPDPNVEPYVVIGDDLYSVSYVREWDDTYEISFTLQDVDYSVIDVLAVDMEDLDLSFHDNMGDYLDQGSFPLMIAPELIAETGHCTATFYNPNSSAIETDTAILPSSILWMQISVE